MNISEMLKKLKTLLRLGILTPTNKVEAGTFICLKETNRSGDLTNYHQQPFEKLPIEWQAALKNKLKGEKVDHANGSVKIIAVFHAWEEEKGA